MNKTIRCAVYTRKSTEDGLEQDFNSLDAQREASLAYIKSQHHEGWRAIKKIYDDGGISGGTLKRPAIQELLSDIKAGQIDTVVVYKVDRLTRSLADFSKLIELFDEHNVSFISVTQQFNTTSSMGRLTLNVLLSFAQFEREITGERIRDKIAASKKKGMWMGGLPPIGYDIQDKKLEINEVEAATVKQIFDLYLETQNVRLVKNECDRLGLRTKIRCYGDQKTGGTRFSRGHLYSLLHNPLYAGKVKSKDEIYEGQHEAIVDFEIWETVQKKLKTGAIDRLSQTNQKQINLLGGLAYDESGQLLKSNYTVKPNHTGNPPHTVKKSKKYCYYVSSGREGWRIPAQTLEQAVEETIIRWLKNEKEIFLSFGSSLSGQSDAFETVKNSAARFAETLSLATLPEKAGMFKRLLRRVVIDKDKLKIDLDGNEICELLDVEISDDDESRIYITAEHRIKRRGVEKKIILKSDQKSSKDEKMIALIARSYQWLLELKNGEVASLSEIARRENINIGDVSRFFQLAFLAPEIIVAIVEGKQPSELTSEKLKRMNKLPHAWRKQIAQPISRESETL